MYTRIYGDFIYRKPCSCQNTRHKTRYHTIPQKTQGKLQPTKFHLVSINGPRRCYDRLNFQIGIRISSWSRSSGRKYTRGGWRTEPGEVDLWIHSVNDVQLK